MFEIVSLLVELIPQGGQVKEWSGKLEKTKNNAEEESADDEDEHLG